MLKKDDKFIVRLTREQAELIAHALAHATSVYVGPPIMSEETEILTGMFDLLTLRTDVDTEHDFTA